MNSGSKKSVEQVFGEVVMPLTSEQQKELIGIMRRMNARNIAVEMTATAAPMSPHTQASVPA